MTMSSLDSNGQSPDLSPTEYRWDVMEREIRIMDVQATNLQLHLCDVNMDQNVKECTLLNLCYKKLRHF